VRKKLKKILFTFYFITTLSFGQNFNNCTKDNVGNNFCAPPNGMAIKTSTGEVVCSVGQCKADLIGNIICSDVAGGGVVKDLVGKVSCYGNCVSPSKDLCKKM